MGGRPKLAMPLGDRTVIERVVATLLDGGVEHVIVVIGPHVAELEPLARAAGGEIVALTEITPDMRTTVEKGLDWIDERYHPAEDDRWLLAPADHPGFTAGVVQALLAANEPQTTFVPAFEGRRGHPVSLRWLHTRGIRALPPGLGINAFLRSHSSAIREQPVDDSGILANLDTPEDYEQLRARYL
jgi:molybdenum cofactor cytidylyltransferase